MPKKKQKKGICPKCGGDVDYGDSEIQDDSISYKYTCTKCGFEGLEWYNIVFTNHSTPDGEEL
jgi:predicted RNA-binding Zn-ribbon protein involved in translation (DUF1610 family)